MTKPTRQVPGQPLRSPCWLGLGWLLGMVCLLTSLSGFALGDLTSATFTGLLMGLPGAWVIVRVPFMRVGLSAEGLAYHGLFRTRRIAWNSVAAVEVEAVNGGTFLTSFAPVLRLHDGQSWPLMQLAGYSTPRRLPRSRVARQATRIRAWIASANT